jgi:hypothetical protein
VKFAFVANEGTFHCPKAPVLNLIDYLVFKKLKRLQLPPSDLCEDHVFLRRAYIDLCGMLPTPAETQRFLDDRHPLKRTRLIEELLERPEYAEYWGFRWNEMLGIPWRLDKKNGAMVLHWFRDHVKQNTPFDRVVRELVSGQPIPMERGPVNFYVGASTPSDWAERTSKAFLGIRVECFQCHPHPRARFSAEDRHQFVALFAQLTLRKVAVPGYAFDILGRDRSREFWHPHTQRMVPPRFLDGTKPANDDRLEALTDWLTSPKNPYFARTMVNRIWAFLHGRGIADPPEAIHELPLTANDELLDALAQSFLAERYDVKQMIRIIMNSRTYQLSSQPNERNKEDVKYFSRAIPKYLPPEVLHDVVGDYLGVRAAIAGMPAGTRAIHVLDAVTPYARPSSRIAECEGEKDDAPLSSTLHYLNSDEIQKRLKDPNNRIHRAVTAGRSDAEIVNDLFFTAFSRAPTQEQLMQIEKHLKVKDRRTAMEDIAWALMNAGEFQRR